MNRVWYVAKAVFAGLCATQILATFHVYVSNQRLFETVTAVKEAGYMAIPNALVTPTLKAMGPAFWGGLFFTLSIGAGLSIFTVIVAWVWDRLLTRSRAWLPLILGLWLAPVVAVNSQGLSVLATAYFLIVPFVVFLATLKGIPPETAQRIWFSRLVPLAPIVVLTVIWTAHADRFLFLNIRDFLLLSNPVGQKVDRFYYRYTLYPAQVFKTLQQKTLRTCRVTTTKDSAEMERLQKVLTENDYLPIEKKGPEDLEIVVSENKLALKQADQEVVQTTLQQFFTGPRKALNDFSTQVDTHGPFRQATIICLVVGFPVLLYLTVFSLLQFTFGFFVSPPRSFVITGCLCFLIGLALLAPLRFGRSKTIAAGKVSEALHAPAWQQQVSGLRAVVDEKLEISDFDGFDNLLSSDHLPVRYWLAKALGVSRQQETYHSIITLLDDPHPNVVSMAFHALAQRRDRRVVKTILERIKTSDHWYNQWYAYRTLRALGWRQKKAI
jgi:hypothetical protein